MTEKGEPQVYRIRYMVEPWGKPIPTETVMIQGIPGVKIMQGPYGYADEVFVASVLYHGEEMDILLLSSEGGKGPSRKLLEAVREQIDHHLKHHCKG